MHLQIKGRKEDTVWESIHDSMQATSICIVSQVRIGWTHRFSSADVLWRVYWARRVLSML